MGREDGRFEDDDTAVAEAVARCASLVIRVISGQGSAADLDAASAEVRRLPDVPMQGFLAAAIVHARLRSSARSPRALRELDALLDITDRHPPPLPQWPQIRDVARGISAAAAGVEGAPVDWDVVTAGMDATAAMAGDNPRLEPMLQALRVYQEELGAYFQGDRAAPRRLKNAFASMRERIADTPIASHLDALAVALSVMTAADDGDGERIRAGTRQLEELSRTHGADQPDLRDAVAHMTVAADILASFTSDPASTGPLTTPTTEQLAALRETADRPDVPAALRSRSLQLLGMAQLSPGGQTDPDRIAAGIEDLRSSVAVLPSAHPNRPFLLQGLGIGLMFQADVTGDDAALAEAAEVLAEARELAGGPEYPHWSLINSVLEQVYRMQGQPAPSRRVALEGLRAQAWSVLLQTDAAGAAQAASRAAETAVEVASACLMDGEPGEAVRALDAGRGLVLFSAVEFRDPPTRLADAGRPDLARRWREATAPDGPGAAPIGLRREVLKALSARVGGGAAELLDPPTVPEIQSALAAIGADALVYLVPGKPPLPGWAVIVPASAGCQYLPLPWLTPDDDVDIERYLIAVSRRNADPAADRDVVVPPPEPRFPGSLDKLCDWAWRAAIGPLLEQYLPAVGPRAGGGRPPRVVLVPMGRLARIPWHAARRGDGTYAVELAAFSQAVSARMLCDSAKWTPVPPAPLGLFVADPDSAGDAYPLAAAREEAYAIRQAFYPGARYLGRRPDGSPSRSGPGSDVEVRDWLASTRPGAGAMLHLACHGVIRAGAEDSTSHLLLAGGSRLTSDELVAVLARSPGRAVGLVVLAACRTGVSHRGYDEAYSLGTAFLAGGVRSVLSTQWPVLDHETSVLMYMFHHYLMAGRQPVHEALRQAQLWMLDPRRQVPREMPRALRERLVDTDPAQVVAWAGFVHWGQ